MRPPLKLKGKKFGSWRVKELAGFDKWRCSYWWCICNKCGKRKRLAGAMLRRGSSNGCMECRRQMTIPSTLWYQIKAGAQTRHIAFKITKEYAYSLFLAQEGQCRYTGLPIKFAPQNRAKGAARSTASLDRIDSIVGYVKGNVQWVHKDINRMKWALTESRFLHLCELVTNRS